MRKAERGADFGETPTRLAFGQPPSPRFAWEGGKN